MPATTIQTGQPRRYELVPSGLAALISGLISVWVLLIEILR